MNNVRHRVTVVIPVYNCAVTLPRAARSILHQTISDWEMLVVDDGSTDGSGEIAGELAQSDPRVRLIALPQNRGKPHAMNLALEQAAGDWLAVLDADDEYEPSRLEVLLGAAEAARADIVADNQLIYDAGAMCAIGAALSEAGPPRPVLASEFIGRCDPYAAFDYGMLKPIVRTAFVRDCHIRYRENARLSEDFLYLAELLASGARMILVPEPLYVWTQAFGSISRRWTTTSGGAWRYDFVSAASAHLALRAEFLGRGEKDFAALLARRAQAFRRLQWLSELNRAWASGAPLHRLLAGLLRHPSIWPAAARRVLRRIGQRSNPGVAGDSRSREPKPVAAQSSR